MPRRPFAPKIRGHFPLPLEDHLFDDLAIHRIGHGTAHAHIIEGRPGGVHDRNRSAASRKSLDLEPAFLFRGHNLLFIHVIGDIDVPGP